MGIFGKIISDAVGDGIGKGIQNAVGKAVESAVKPAADKLAGQAADRLNQASQDLADSTAAAASAGASAEAAAAAGAAAPAAAGTSAPAGEGAASLGAALSGWASAMQGMAGQVAQNMKECPACGEVVTADRKFCPSCGAKLPDRTVGADFVCSKCGRQNLPGETYCAECGALLPGAEAKNAAQLAKWDSMLPCYPKWDLGGSVELDEGGEINGHASVSLHVGGAGAARLAQYVGLLEQNGFVPAYDGDSDVYYKVVDGVCRAFDKTDADQGGALSMTFFVGDYDKRAAAAKKADDALDTAKDAAKAAADAAKGLFKKFF